MAKNALDAPLSIGSFKDLSAACDSLKSNLEADDSENLNEALTYLMTYARVEYNVHASPIEREALLVSLTNGTTPRQIIILGHLIWLEQNRIALAAENKSGENATDKGAQLRQNMGKANQKAAYEIIHRYLIPATIPTN